MICGCGSAPSAASKAYRQYKNYFNRPLSWWWSNLVFFCFNANRPYKPRCHGHNSKEYFNQSEASRSNWHKVQRDNMCRHLWKWSIRMCDLKVAKTSLQYFLVAVSRNATKYNQFSQHACKNPFLFYPHDSFERLLQGPISWLIISFLFRGVKCWTIS